jgi:hypothetical protein
MGNDVIFLNDDEYLVSCMISSGPERVMVLKTLVWFSESGGYWFLECVIDGNPCNICCKCDIFGV